MKLVALSLMLLIGAGILCPPAHAKKSYSYKDYETYAKYMGMKTPWGVEGQYPKEGRRFLFFRRNPKPATPTLRGTPKLPKRQIAERPAMTKEGRFKGLMRKLSWRRNQESLPGF